ncbi:MAG: hypothetical protein AAGC55_21580, partial [Myxococcota bacterium]
EWIKQAQRSSYAVGEPPGGLGQVLIGVRSGNDPVDRRGIGELRVGVQAKGLSSGLLLAPQDLSDIAITELRRPGPSIAVVVGDALVAELARQGIGVLPARLQVPKFDGSFFDEVENL